MPTSTAPRAATVSFLSAMTFASATSGAIVCVRLSAGRLWVSLLANAVATLVALLLVPRRRGGGAAVALPIAGAVLGVVAVHALLWGVGGLAPWLSEAPAQWMNDAVAVTGVLVMATALARRPPRTALLLVTLLLLSLYRATGARWHLDHPPHGFMLTVQQWVFAEVLAAALGMWAFRRLARGGA